MVTRRVAPSTEGQGVKKRLPLRVMSDPLPQAKRDMEKLGLVIDHWNRVLQNALKEQEEIQTFIKVGFRYLQQEPNECEIAEGHPS